MVPKIKPVNILKLKELRQTHPEGLEYFLKTDLENLENFDFESFDEWIVDTDRTFFDIPVNKIGYPKNDLGYLAEDVEVFAIPESLANKLKK